MAVRTTVRARPARTRITAGEWRGRTVDTPPGTAMRPTTSLVREALFNILGERIAGANVVDLYAGAGTISFEALSRGARAVVAVERDPGTAALIRATAERLGCADRIRTAVTEVNHWLRHRPHELQDAALCYVDAPYRDDAVIETLRLCGEAPPRLVVCEHHRARVLPETVGDLRRVRTATYGTTHLTFYDRGPGQPATPAGEETMA